MTDNELLDWFDKAWAGAWRETLVRDYGWKRETVNTLSDGAARFIGINIWLDERDEEAQTALMSEPSAVEQMMNPPSAIETVEQPPPGTETGTPSPSVETTTEETSPTAPTAEPSAT